MATASGLDNDQPFPSINQMDKLAANADGSLDFYFGPRSQAKARTTSRRSPVSGSSFACGSTAP